ncbi:DNA-formamidopyrimidine glycosylase family protein [Pedobacter sandarakinus]|uniref:DNA-formamidopyrimidine glycosylase family protein n=1 Tax=Pedobacter sandarakinus TaxID=353156 RepID=UPI00224841E1|nr:DNA-formamidopyrimidine glycosylase family protein [Pedobacter sandarakinus]MCX2574082.1 formamidopyrimidine-DNA glycosylase [Pedobacter sandarakinus]
MAELPDLTVFAKILTKRFQGKVLETLDVSVAKKIKVTGTALKKALEGRELLNVEREGKTLQLIFSGSQVLGLHLMLRGELVLFDQDEPPRYQILGFHFEGGEAFSLVDLQKHATPTLNPEKIAVPDALDLQEKDFLDLLARKRTTIKTLLMDQHLIRGIGNSYSDEILYQAGISPLSIAKAIPANHAKKLFKSIGETLRTAIEQIAKENGNELKGELRDFMHVHRSSMEKTDKGEKILSTKIGGRKSYYTAEQQLFK